MDRDGKRDEKATRDPDAPATAEETAAAEALRVALEDPRRPDAAADFARALSLAHSPRPIALDEHRALVDRAIDGAEAERRRPIGADRKRRTIRMAGAVGGLALAAAIALSVGTGTARFDSEPAPAAPVSAVEPLAPVRSTQPLFREPFARAGGESARIDRIATARSADLRGNRFAAWGVR